MALKDIVYRQTNIGGEFPIYTGSDPDVNPWKVPLWEEKAEMIPLFYQYVQECHADGYTTTWGTWKQLLSRK